MIDRPRRGRELEDLLDVLGEADFLRLGIRHEDHFRFRARHGHVQESPRFRLFSFRADLFQRHVSGAAVLPGERLHLAAQDEAARLVDQKDFRRLQRELEIGQDDRVELQPLRRVDSQNAHRVAGLIDQRRLHLVGIAAPPRDLVDELPHRSAETLVIRKCDGANVFEMPQRSRPVRGCRIDRLDVACADDEVDDLRHGEMLRSRAERVECLEEGGVGFIDTRNLRIRQRKVRRPRRGDFRAAIERKRDRAQHRQQIDRCGTIEKEPRRRENIRNPAPLEDIEVVVEFRQPAEEQRVAAQIASSVCNPCRDRLRLGSEAIVPISKRRVDHSDRGIRFDGRLHGSETVVRRPENVRIVSGIIEQLREDGVDGIEQRRIAAVLIEQFAMLGSRRDQLAREGVVGLGIGAAETVDRLLRIADHNRPSVDERAASIARQPVDDPRLHAIRVLKLVDEDVVELAAHALDDAFVVEDGQRSQQQIVEIDDAALALLAIEEGQETAHHRQQRHRCAMRRQPVVDAVALVLVGAQHADRFVELGFPPFRQIARANRVRDRLQIFEPHIDVASSARRRMIAQVVADAGNRIGIAAAQPLDGDEQLVLDQIERAKVVRIVEEQIAPVDQRQDDVADQEEVADMFEQHFPIAPDLRRRMEPRLLVNPRVVQLAVQERALESFDDRELRIESGLDGELPKDGLAERVDRLRAKRLDARQLRGTRSLVRVALVRRHLEKRRGGADRPRCVFARIEAQ